MEQFIANFGRELIEVPFISENNAVHYKLKMTGITKYCDTGPSITLNDVKLSNQIFVDGLNVTRLGPSNRVIETKSYLFATTDTSINQGFVTYMNQLNTLTDVVLFTASKGLKSSKVVDDWFTSAGSTAWLGADFINKFECSYVGIFNTTDGRIVKELFLMSDGANKDPVILETIYDDYKNLGACGYPQKFIEDSTEYSTNSEFMYKFYPTVDNQFNQLSSFGITSDNKVVVVSCELKCDQVATTEGYSSGLVLEWWSENSWIAERKLIADNSVPDAWRKMWLEMRIPSNAVGFKLIACRYPDSLSQSRVSIKNVIMSLASTEQHRTSTEFGVNGIRIDHLVDGGLIPPQVMTLVNANSDVINIVPVNGIREIALN